jgi:hypothetical protein
MVFLDLIVDHANDICRAELKIYDHIRKHERYDRWRELTSAIKRRHVKGSHNGLVAITESRSDNLLTILLEASLCVEFIPDDDSHTILVDPGILAEVFIEILLIGELEKNKTKIKRLLIESDLDV